ncbi:MAG: Bax inhibitor-1 family protein [Gemmataceae bacterium]|nr:Bax inhibitor-1 family protein [Gemmataceae bacterium]
MSYVMDSPLVAARATESARAGFIRRTYAHLAGAILAFTAIEILMFAVIVPDKDSATNLVRSLFGQPFSMILLFAAFIGFGWLAQMWAQSNTSPGVQYLGLGLYIVLEAVIFLPILCIAIYYVPNTTPAQLLGPAAALTLALFAGLTLTVFVTKRDYSFLRPILCIGMFIAVGLVIAAYFFGFSLGLLFSFAIVALAAGFILYDTSNVLHHYRTDQHVAAALQLFASVALMFYYVLWILINLSGNRE